MRLIVVAVALWVAVLASAQAQPIQDAPTTAPKQDAAALDRGQSGQDRPARAKPRGEDQRIATPRTTGAGYTSPRACSVRARAYSFVTPKGRDRVATRGLVVLRPDPAYWFGSLSAGRLAVGPVIAS